MQPTAPSGSLTTSASWVDSIEGITLPGRVAADLGVVVERGGRPADLVGVLDQRLAALGRHQLGELVGAGAQPVGDLVQHLGPLDRGRVAPSRARPRRGGDGRVELVG